MHGALCTRKVANADTPTALIGERDGSLWSTSTWMGIGALKISLAGERQGSQCRHPDSTDGELHGSLWSTSTWMGIGALNISLAGERLERGRPAKVPDSRLTTQNEVSRTATSQWAPRGLPKT